MSLEVVADDGEGRRVGEGGAGTEQDAVRQVQWNYLMERGFNHQMDGIT